MISSLFSLMKIGILRSVIVMVSHGLCSSGLFYMVNMYYLRSYRRLIIINKGHINYIAAVMV
jgi:NADH:ubiquinone oxidoreductase subunit 4 (subunit M)